VVRIDQILRSRPDVKGIVHTVSYARKEFLMKHSRERERLMDHNSHNTVERVRAFKGSSGAPVLVSPSVVTGWDFPYSECRFQIIGKVPFPDTRNAILRVRCRRDSQYRNYLTAQSLVQAYGRGMRAADDWCECFVIDDNIGWFLNHAGGLVPDWFRKVIRKHRTIPKRLEV
jgi:Rad3-related DNA helicase